jgi:hypothetical protein
MSGTRFMSPKEVRVMMHLAGEVHKRRRALPLEINSLNRAIKEKTRLALAYYLRLGAIDEALVREIGQLRRVKDAVYGRWVA